jgi:pyrroline-5-carboxylate reductase
MPRIAFIGAGRMAAAMVEGLLARKSAPAADIGVIGGSGASARDLASRTGVSCPPSLTSLLEGADVVVVAFKPQHLAAADPRLAALTAGRLVISVLAGKRLERLSAVFPGARNIVRCMPNTPARIGAGITAWCAAGPLNPADAALLASLLGALGTAVEVDESQMDAVTGLSGSGPAYVFEFAAALRDGGVAAGLNRAVAEKLAIETLLGAARLLARDPAGPEALRDQVTSPNGTTLAGLRRLEAGAFRELIRATIAAAAARSRELSAES